MSHKNTGKTENDLLVEINKLEFEVTTLNEDLRAVGNDEKVENFKLSVIQAKRDEITGEIEFYKNYVLHMRRKLENKQQIHSKFLLADKYYETLIESYRENYLQNNLSKNNDKKEKIEMNTADIQKQIEKLQAEISNNDKIIKEMLEALETSTEH